MARVSFDTGVLIALERREQRAWAWMRRASERGLPPLVSSAAVGESWRGARRGGLARALEGCDVVPVTDRIARTAGEACAAVGAGTLDAMIAATAAEEGALLLTGDAADMQVLGEHFRSLRIAVL